MSVSDRLMLCAMKTTCVSLHDQYFRHTRESKSGLWPAVKHYSHSATPCLVFSYFCYIVHRWLDEGEGDGKIAREIKVQDEYIEDILEKKNVCQVYE